MIPEALVRIVELEDGVIGHRYTIWPLGEDGQRVHSRQEIGLLDDVGWRQRVGQAECRVVRRGERFVVCEARAASRVNWRAIMTTLDSLAVHRGPAPGGCPPGLDGAQTIVELRTPTTYTQYECWSPSDQSTDLDAQRIGKVQRIAWRGSDR